MDFLEKLDYLMEKRGLNKNTLSKSCSIPYTTIDGWYKKGYEGLKLTTLKKLSGFFGMPLDYWANDDMQEIPYFSSEEIELIAKYNAHPEMQKAVNKLLDIE